MVKNIILQDMNFKKLVMCIRIKKYKAKLKTMSRIAFTSSCLVLFKEFGPYPNGDIKL